MRGRDRQTQEKKRKAIEIKSAREYEGSKRDLEREKNNLVVVGGP